MATHNETRTVGYLTKDPKIVDLGNGAKRAFFTIHTTHREVDGYYGFNENSKMFEDILIFYDGEKLMPKIEALKAYDVVDIKGVFNVLPMNKRSMCPGCGEINVKEYATSTFVYPISLLKINTFSDTLQYGMGYPEELLVKHYQEVSNQITLIGSIATDPEFTGTEKHPCTRYKLRVDRKYYINTQSDIYRDYPWVYSYGKQAVMDAEYLEKGMTVMLVGFIRNREVQCDMQCAACGANYQYPDVATEFIPYSVEYFEHFNAKEESTEDEE